MQRNAQTCVVANSNLACVARVHEVHVPDMIMMYLKGVELRPI